jgi:hypothetical protein
VAVSEHAYDRAGGVKVRESIAIAEMFNPGSFWHGSIMPSNYASSRGTKTLKNGPEVQKIAVFYPLSSTKTQ